MTKRKRQTIAAVILTFNNNTEVLKSALHSLQWMDQVICVDSGSTDGTPELIRRLVPHAQVIFRSLDSFALQRNAGLETVTSDWVLHLDSDMVINETMTRDIERILDSDPRENGFHFVLHEYILGYPTHLRSKSVHALHRNGVAKWTGIIDEKLNISGPVGVLKGHVDHYGVVSVGRMIDKYNGYSKHKAIRYAFEANKPGRLFLKSIVNPLRLFFRLYIKKRGYRDGVMGFHYAVIRAFNVYLTFVKIWEQSVIGKRHGHE